MRSNIKMKGYIVGITIFFVVLLGVGGGYYWFLLSDTPSYDTAPVKRGSITQSVSASGNVATSTTINLQFQNSGKLTFVGVKVGDKVTAGEVVMRQDMSALSAQLRSAQAGLTLALQRASASTNNLANVVAQQNALVASAYRNLLSGLTAVPDSDAYGVTAPSISGIYEGPEGQYKVYIDKKNITAAADLELRTFNLERTDPIQIEQNGPTQLGTYGLYLTFPDALEDYYNTIWYVTIPNTKSTSYVSNYNSYQEALRTRDKTIADAQASLGTTDSSAVINAQIAQAQAEVTLIQAQLAQTSLVAPVDGIVTQVNGDEGETISPNDIVVSIIPGTKLQTNINLFEDNVANVKIGDAVSIMLNAFPNTRWQGTVTEIEPAQTIIEGAVYYKTTVLFKELDTDTRIKAGMTANVLIETGTSSDTLLVPASAIETNGADTFVKLFQSGEIVNQTVTTGLKSQDGMVEITSGLAEGQLVVTGTR